MEGRNSVFFLGAENSGKSTLLRYLLDPKHDPKTLKTMPTVGVSHFNYPIEAEAQKGEKRRFFACGSGKKTATNAGIVLKELGGTLAQNWTQYTVGSKRVVFLVDASDLTRIAQVAFHVNDVLNALQCEDEDEKADFLIVYSKIDILDPHQVSKQISTIRNLLRVDDLINGNAHVRINEAAVSSFTAEGINRIANWLMRSF